MNEILEYLRWQVILSMKRTIVDLEYRYNLNLQMIENMKIDNLSAGINSRQNDNEKLLLIKEETMNILQSLFNIDSVEKMDEYLLLNFESIVEIISSNPNLWELNLNNYYNFQQINVNDSYISNLLIILRKQKEYFPSNYTGFSDTIYKDILSIIKADNYSLFEIYEGIIKNNFFNPNIGGCGTSNEKFWCSLPSSDSEAKNVITLNRKVILDKRTNYHIMSNGLIYINVYLEKALKRSEYSLNEKLYCLNLIRDVIKENNCSIIETKFMDGLKEIEDNRFIKNILFGDYQREVIEIVKDLRNYLLSDEGVRNQIGKIDYSTLKKNESIDLYLSAINDSDNVSIELVKKLKRMKI